MAKEVKTIDTNFIIRYFAEDDSGKAEAVENLIKKAGSQELEMPDVIVAEIVWVLLSFYELSKKEVIEKLEALLVLKKIKMNRKVFQETITIFQQYNVSFVDAYLAAFTLQNKRKGLYSYDKGLDKIKGLNRLVP